MPSSIEKHLSKRKSGQGDRDRDRDRAIVDSSSALSRWNLNLIYASVCLSSHIANKSHRIPLLTTEGTDAEGRRREWHTRARQKGKEQGSSFCPGYTTKQQQQIRERTKRPKSKEEVPCGLSVQFVGSTPSPPNQSHIHESHSVIPPFEIGGGQYNTVLG